MKKGHSNPHADKTAPYPTNPDVALVPIEGGPSPSKVKELPPLALQYDEWVTIGRLMKWDYPPATDADTPPLSNNRMGEHLIMGALSLEETAKKLRSAASALNHGRLNTARKKVELAHQELCAPLMGEINNAIRAEYGARGVAAGNPDHGQNDIYTSVSDSLANIMHFCKREGLDLDVCLSMAETHFSEELEEENA